MRIVTWVVGAALATVACDAGDEAIPVDAQPVDAAPDAFACPGTLAPCGYADNGWNVWCADGQVWTEDLTEVVYCGSNDAQCSVRQRPDPFERVTCPAGCADTDLHYFGDLMTYNYFDPSSLCAAPAR